MKPTDHLKIVNTISGTLTPSQWQRALGAFSTANTGQSSYSLIEERIADKRKFPRLVVIRQEARDMGGRIVFSATGAKSLRSHFQRVDKHANGKASQERKMVGLCTTHKRE